MKSNMKPLTAGRVARRILAYYGNDPKKWCRGTFAKDNRGNRLHRSNSYKAASCCPLGAVAAVLGPKLGHDFDLNARFFEAWDCLNAAVGRDVGIAYFNDSCKSFDELKAKLHEIAKTP